MRLYRVFILSAIAVISVAAIIYSAFFLYASSFRGRALPNVYVGKIPVGGMAWVDVRNLLRDRNSALSQAGIRVLYEYQNHSGSFVLYPFSATDDSARELISLDPDAGADMIVAFGKGSSWWGRTIAPFKTLARSQSINLFDAVTHDDARIRSMIEDRVKAYETVSRDAGIEIHSIEPLSYDIIPESSGISYNYDQAISEMISSWSRLQRPDIRLAADFVYPTIRKDDVELIANRLQNIFANWEIAFTNTDSKTKAIRKWQITGGQLAKWLKPVRLQENNEVAFGIDNAAVSNYIETNIVPEISVEARDAKFRVDANGKVIEFQGSRAGVAVDVDATVAAFQNFVIMRNSPSYVAPKEIPAVIQVAEPHITTGEVNTFGISEVLGVGESNFLGSPGNRVKNIRHAVEKLNGILVKPGETFSTLAYLRPFTQEDGYLPELVIKGDELKPDIGGGLCQIGTTLFRMAMNSGMNIIERRSHSLVVNYYADPRNKNPGTDATIYDPSPDFRFLNDTNNYVLIQADIKERTGELSFALWGTNDGRSASYTAPIVKRWIPHDPETKIIESVKLKPGEKKCQHAFNGAESSFIYSRLLNNGKLENRLFESYYRPLPEVCLVGVAEKTASSTFDNIELIPSG